ncbi:hypothetical protein RI054_27g111420 [Pseudoscourfieldia marina]
MQLVQFCLRRKSTESSRPNNSSSAPHMGAYYHAALRPLSSSFSAPNTPKASRDAHDDALTYQTTTCAHVHTSASVPDKRTCGGIVVSVKPVPNEQDDDEETVVLGILVPPKPKERAQTASGENDDDDDDDWAVLEITRYDGNLKDRNIDNDYFSADGDVAEHAAWGAVPEAVPPFNSSDVYAPVRTITCRARTRVRHAAPLRISGTHIVSAVTPDGGDALALTFEHRGNASDVVVESVEMCGATSQASTPCTCMPWADGAPPLPLQLAAGDVASLVLLPDAVRGGDDVGSEGGCEVVVGYRCVGEKVSLWLRRRVAWTPRTVSAVTAAVDATRATIWAANHSLDEIKDAEMTLPDAWGGHIVSIGRLAPGETCGVAVRRADGVADDDIISPPSIVDRTSRV